MHPNYAHTTVLDWMEKKYQLVKKLPSPPPHSISTVQKPIQKPNIFLENLKREHRSNPNGRQIINLPKTPYGKHRSYNGNSEFIKRHIVDTNAVIGYQTSKELNEVARKFKLVAKRSKTRTVMMTREKPRKFRELEDCYEEMLKTGKLICPINKSLDRSYENVKLKYKSVATPKVTPKTFHESITVSGNSDVFLSRKSSPKVSIRDVLNRLYQSPGKKSVTKRSVAIENKYRPLFEKGTDHHDVSWNHLKQTFTL